DGTPQEARIYVHRGGRTEEHQRFSFGWASEYSWGGKDVEARAQGSGRLRWAGTFSAGPADHGGSCVDWSFTISAPSLATPATVPAVLDAFEQAASPRQ